MAIAVGQVTRAAHRPHEASARCAIVFIYTQRAIRELVHLRLSNKRRAGCKQLADRLGGKSRRRVRFFPIRTSRARDKPLNVEVVFSGKFETPQRSR